ncbi:MAG: hypothetical protein ACT4QG_22190 [Sporichthyaceae bacterium]
MNDDGVIDLLRAAGNGGGASDLGPVMRAGNRIRRRRRIAQAAGGGTGLAAVVALGLFATGIGGGQTVVVGPAGGGPEPAASGAELAKKQSSGDFTRADYDANIELMLAYLGPGFRKGAGGEQGQVMLDEFGPLAKELPAGYSVAARLSVFRDTDSGGFSYATQCKGMSEKDTRIGACTNTTLDDGRVVGVQDYRTIGFERKIGAWDATFASYDRGPDWVRVEFYAFDTREAKTPSADQQAVIAWLGDWTDRLTNLAAAPAVAPNPAAKAAAKATSNRQANQALLLKHLGADWRVDEGDHVGDVIAIPGSATDRQLPQSFEISAGLSVGGADRELADVCKPMVEKGLHVEACTPFKLSDGRTAYIQKTYTVPGEHNPPAPRRGIFNSSDTLTVLLDRADDTFVQVEINVRDSRTTTPKADQKLGAEWLADWRDKLVAIADDPGVAPKVGAQTGPEAPIGTTRHEVYQGYLQEALGTSFSLIDGKVVLEPKSEKYNELPFTSSDVTGELEFVSTSQFEGACNARAGLEPCETATLPDGRTVHWRTWADRDSSDGTMRGEFGMYLPRDDGNVVMAALTLTGTNSPESKRRELQLAVVAWFESLREALTTAVTDTRMGADVYPSR